MLSYSVISFVILWISLSSGSLLTSELLECRANLTAAIKNDTTFLEKVRQSDYIFTGKVKELQHGQLLHVRVKRAIKGALNVTVDLLVNDTCGRYIRRSYTGIFMARRGANNVGRIVMHFGPVPLTLANLDRLNAAVRAHARRLSPSGTSWTSGYTAEADSEGISRLIVAARFTDGGFHDLCCSYCSCWW
ncbi:hypothetical protein G5I_11319 [Acromyrmex echinatior]|uniref:NtA domain-containing protein n=1 Tax=Acromyrmex echinatior TaxID=103372 RepID=F4WZA4_ACREC|nr:hypothetical protein G5I_11319 [Acromyrmex echinatior]